MTTVLYDGRTQTLHTAYAERTRGLRGPVVYCAILSFVDTVRVGGCDKMVERYHKVYLSADDAEPALRHVADTACAMSEMTTELIARAIHDTGGDVHK